MLRYSLIFVCLTSGLCNGEVQKAIPLEARSRYLNSDEESAPSWSGEVNGTSPKVPKVDLIVEQIKQLLGLRQNSPWSEKIAGSNFSKTAKQVAAAPDAVENGSQEMGLEPYAGQGSTPQVESGAEPASAEERHADLEEDEKSDTIQVGHADSNAVAEEVTEEVTEDDIIEATNLGLQAMNDLYYIKEPKLFLKGLFLDADNPAKYVAAFNDQTEEARKLAQFGYASIEATKAFKRKFPEVLRQGSFIPISQGSDLHRQCPKRGIPQCKTASLRYRTADGSCNNRHKLWWGSSMSPMQRFGNHSTE